MRKIFLAIALIKIASVGTAARSGAALPGGGNVTLTLRNISDACVWVTWHENTRELGTKVLEPDHTWIVERYVTGGVAKVRAQIWSPKNGCHGSFIQDRYDFIEGKTTLTILKTATGSYIMQR
jgi:hypothetical protein